MTTLLVAAGAHVQILDKTCNVLQVLWELTGTKMVLPPLLCVSSHCHYPSLLSCEGWTETAVGLCLGFPRPWKRCAGWCGLHNGVVAEGKSWAV
jgi:hypothetical protein